MSSYCGPSVLKLLATSEWVGIDRMTAESKTTKHRMAKDRKNVREQLDRYRSARAAWRAFEPTGDRWLDYSGKGDLMSAALDARDWWLRRRAESEQLQRLSIRVQAESS